MLKAMRLLSIDYLFEKLGDKNNVPQNTDEWYRELRSFHPEQIFSFLVESGENIEKLYTLERCEENDMVRLTIEDMTAEKAKWLPFMRPSGSQGAQIGPVIKRSYSKKEGAGPKAKILNTTMRSFEEIAASDKPWSSYFSEVVDILGQNNLQLPDNSIINLNNAGFDNILIAAVDKIGVQKNTVFLTVRDKNGWLPGQRRDYVDYLMKERLCGMRYVTGTAPEISHQNCPLCGETGITVFPNALKGAGMNISNADRAGVFPDIDSSQAWKKYALCNACADLLYIYKYHFLKRDANKKNPFITPVAGESAIIIPYAITDHHARQRIWRKVKDFIESISSDVEETELTILDILKEEQGILNITFLWATIGQNIEDVTGMITNVPPSRLKELSEFQDSSKGWKHPLFPDRFLWKELRPDLGLSALDALFRRPGGRKAKEINASMKLWQLKRGIAASVYHKAGIPVTRFWQEIMTTAQWHWQEAIQSGNTYGLLNEGISNRTGEVFLTTAGWIRHLCWWINYFKKLEVMKMESIFFEPQMEKLKPYFGIESGINSPEKAYAFLLGVLYGKLIEVQGARGVNVSANALTWLKRLTLKGKDLPELYIKMREKLLAYETEKSPDVRALIEEIGKLGVRLGDCINLEEVQTNYYLLLGQSLTKSILHKKE